MTTALYTHAEGTLTTKDGTPLYTQCWQPTQPKATLVLIHGIAEHSSRYRHVGEYLAEHGYTVHALDLRGHGRSPGARALIRQMEEHAGDVADFLAWVRTQAPTIPLFLLGHSMGGLIVTYYVLQQNPTLTGVILSGPALKLGNVSPLTITLGRLLARWFPGLPLAPLDTTAISRDQVVIQANHADPLVYHGRIPVGTGLAMLNAIAYIQGHMEAFSLPLLIVQGAADRLVDPLGSQQLYARAQATDKTLKLYDGLYHEVLNEPEKAAILAEIVAWLDARCVVA
ncbi:MAG: lysophospholipase [Caldilineaceae bacterium]|nr:lysophospholipase [Caldilineaceae bacterium]